MSNEKFERYYHAVLQIDSVLHQDSDVNAYLDRERFESKAAAVEMKGGRDYLEVETFAVLSNVML